MTNSKKWKKRNYYSERVYLTRTKYPKRVEVVMEADHGGYLEKTILSLPEEFEVDKSFIPPEKENMNAFYIRTPVFVITFYKDTKKCFVYTLSGKWLGNLEKSDLNKLFSKIGAILRHFKK